MSINFSILRQNSTYKIWTTKTKILLFLVIGIITINFTYKIFNNNCYNKCSDYHLLGDVSHWNYHDFIIDNEDTIWVDEECYQDWCICIDECNPGLCCELLK